MLITDLTRTNFLNIKPLNLSPKAPINVYIVDVEEVEPDAEEDLEYVNISGAPKAISEKSESEYEMRKFGILESGESVLIDISGFGPYFYIRDKVTNIFDIWHINNFNMDTKKDQIIAALQRGKQKWATDIIPSECKFVRAKNFLGYDGVEDGHWHLKLVFTTAKAYRGARSYFRYNSIFAESSVSRGISLPTVGINDVSFSLYESNFDIYLKMFHTKNIFPAGWISVTNHKEESSEGLTGTRCQKYFKCSWKDINTVDQKKCQPPKWVHAAYDIECISAARGFPKAEIQGDEIIQIVISFKKYFEQSDADNWDVVLTQKLCTNNFTDSKEGKIFLFCYATEEDLLSAFCYLIQNMDPDSLTGYNTHGFDDNYIWTRALRYKATSKYIKQLGRLKRDYPSSLDHFVLQSSALGFNDHYIIPMRGRIRYDLLKEFQKEPEKLEEYGLNAVAKKFLVGEAKGDLSAQQIFAHYADGSPDKIYEIAIYCLQDTRLCHKLEKKQKFLHRAMEMGNICKVPLKYIFRRGQTAKLMSLVVKAANDYGYLIDEILANRARQELRDRLVKEGKKLYLGAHVVPPIIGFHKTPVMVLDFNSLYPSNAILFNIGHNTIICDRTIKQYNLFPGCNPSIKAAELMAIAESQGNKLKNTKFYTHETNDYIDAYFVQPTGTNISNSKNLSVISLVCINLLEERNKIKKEMNSAVKESVEYNRLNCIQLAYKVCVNSVYGILGSPLSPLYLEQCAAAITRVGRKIIQMATHIAEAEPIVVKEKAYNVHCIYGDSVGKDTKIEYYHEPSQTKTVFAFDDLDNLNWMKRQDGKEFLIPNPGTQVITEKGLMPLKTIIRHKTNKKIYKIKIRLPDGKIEEIICTQDHGLLTDVGQLVSPLDLKEGDALMAVRS